MKNAEKKNIKGFTLLEILIATAIFAMVMVMTTAVVGLSSSSQSKLKAVRGSSEDGRRVADLISRNIKFANKEGTVWTAQADDLTVKDMTTSANGVFLLDCHIIDPDPAARTCNGFKNNLTPSGYATSNSDVLSKYKANTMVLLIKNGDKTAFRIFHSDGKTLRFYSYDGETDATGAPINGVEIRAWVLNSLNNANTIIAGGADPSGVENDVSVLFGGFVPSHNTTLYLQPYVSFNVNTKTRGTGLTVRETFETNIRSMATIRNYNP